jgi:hypothetical protein
MNKMTDIQRKIDEAMDSIVGINRAMPTPFLYTRLSARISKRENSYWERLSQVITRPAFAVITVSMVLMLNLFVAINESSATTPKPNVSEMATIDDLGANSFYDIENVQP